MFSFQFSFREWFSFFFFFCSLFGYSFCFFQSWMKLFACNSVAATNVIIICCCCCCYWLYMVVCALIPYNTLDKSIELMRTILENLCRLHILQLKFWGIISFTTNLINNHRIWRWYSYNNTKARRFRSYAHIHNRTLQVYSQDYDLPSNTIHVVCVNFIREWRHL